MPRKPRKPARRRRNSGSISVAGDGTIRARLPAWLDPSRRAREFPPGHQAEAAAWLDSQVAARLDPQPEPVAPAVVVGQWIDQWYATWIEPLRPPNTARTYLQALRHLEPLYDVPLADLRPSQLQALVGTLSARLSPHTVQGYAGVWKRCLEAAVDDRLVERNPAKHLTLPRAQASPPARHLTRAEVDRLLPAIVGHRFEAAYALLIGCGLRIGEVLGLHWTDVRLHERRAWIASQWTNGEMRPTPKARNPHWIPLPLAVVASLIRHRNAQPPGCVLVMQSPWQSTAKKHTAITPRPWSRETVADDLTRLLDELGLERGSSHSARHGLSTYLLNAGVPAADVAQLLGHTSVQTTLRSYSHESGDTDRLGRAVDEYLGTGPDGDAGTATA